MDRADARQQGPYDYAGRPPGFVRDFCDFPVTMPNAERVVAMSDRGFVSDGLLSRRDRSNTHQSDDASAGSRRLSQPCRTVRRWSRARNRYWIWSQSAVLLAQCERPYWS